MTFLSRCGRIATCASCARCRTRTARHRCIDGRGPRVSEVLVRADAGSHMMRPVLWAAVTVLALEAAAGLVGASLLSYRAVTTAGFVGGGGDVLGRTSVVVLLLVLVSAVTAMGTAIVRHRVRGGTPGRPLAWASATVLVVHALLVLACLMRAEWAVATAVTVGAVVLGSAWSHCVRRHR